MPPPTQTHKLDYPWIVSNNSLSTTLEKCWCCPIFHYPTLFWYPAVTVGWNPRYKVYKSGMKVFPQPNHRPKFTQIWAYAKNERWELRPMALYLCNLLRSFYNRPTHTSTLNCTRCGYLNAEAVASPLAPDIRRHVSTTWQQPQNTDDYHDDDDDNNDYRNARLVAL